MRMLGQKPMGVQAFAEYIRVVRGLLRGEEVAYTLNGVTHPIRFQMREFHFIDVEHHIPIHVGGFGPRAQALAGELGDGLITGIPRGGGIPQALANVRQGAARAGRTLEHFYTSALVNLVMLEPGEAFNSARIIAACGAAIMANVHYLVDWVKETSGEPPEYVRPIWNEYMAFHHARDAQRRHQKLHESHYTYLDPEEARFVTPEMVKAFCIAGRPEEIVEQLRELERQGLNAINCALRLDTQYRFIEDFARHVMAHM
jgi:alkanesulfonate monooxygenase SsuD/methylene tetrahydromethanopterin reductase-like flavin-dependent oxidoreductase (luciferase family)